MFGQPVSVNKCYVLSYSHFALAQNEIRDDVDSHHHHGSSLNRKTVYNNHLSRTISRLIRKKFIIHQARNQHKSFPSLYGGTLLVTSTFETLLGLQRLWMQAFEK